MMLKKLMDEYWEKFDDSRNETLIHPSSFSSLCLREYYHILSGEIKRKSHEPKQKRLLSRAKSVHDEIQKIWKDMGILEGNWLCLKCGKSFYALSPQSCECGGENFSYEEIPLSSEGLHMEGHADGILVMGNQKYLAEIKSINTYSFSRLYSPEKSHITQIHCYFLMSELDKCWLCYVNRDNGEYKIFLVEKNEETIDQIFVQSKLLWLCLEKKTPPPLNYNDSVKYCQKFCSASALCKMKEQWTEDWMFAPLKELKEAKNAPEKRKRGRPKGSGKKAVNEKKASGKRNNNK